MEERKPSRVEAAIERLNQDPYLLATITAIPGVGGSITQVITGIGQQIVQERNVKLFEQLSEHLADIDEQSIRRDYFETPEGFDLLIRAMDESRKTRSDKKRDLIAKILTGATSTDAGRGEYSPEEYLNLVADLTDKEWEIARTIYTLQQDISPRELDSSNKLGTWEKCVESISKEHDIGADDLFLLLNRLYSAGLVDLFYVSVPGSPIPTYWVSPTFRKLVEFLRLRT